MVFGKALGRGRVLRQVFCRPDGTDHQVAGAVRASIIEALFGTVGAEGAFERAHASIGGVGRQVLVTAFTVWFEQQHLGIPFRSGGYQWR